MPNPHRGETPLPGTDKVLRFSVNALCEVEAASGENMLAILSRIDSGETPTFSQTRLLLWGGLRDENATLGEAGDILQDVGVAAAMAAMAEALRRAFGAAEESPGPKA